MTWHGFRAPAGPYCRPGAVRRCLTASEASSTVTVRTPHGGEVSPGDCMTDDKIALLAARVAALKSKEASLVRARADFMRADALYARHAISRETFMLRAKMSIACGLL